MSGILAIWVGLISFPEEYNSGNQIIREAYDEVTLDKVKR